MTIDLKLAEFADRAARQAKEKFEFRLEMSSKDCESPIEKLMLAALLVANSDACNSSNGIIVYGAERFPAVRELFLKGDWNRMEARHCSIAPQFEIGEYRVDFCLSFSGDNDDECRFSIVVECDGHEWHERTPAQAQRDKARDRAIQAEGFLIMRFTGSEIWRDAQRCADEVFKAAEREMYRRMGIDA